MIKIFCKKYKPVSKCGTVALCGCALSGHSSKVRDRPAMCGTVGAVST